MAKLEQKILSLKQKNRKTEEGFKIPLHPFYGKWFLDNAQAMRRDIGKSDYDYDFYVSGGMTGLDGHNFHRFHVVTAELRKAHLRVFNPAENFGGARDKSRSTYMRKDHRAVTRCGNIIMLPSFPFSDGALAELRTALSIPDMGIFTLNQLEGSQSIVRTLILQHRQL